VLVALMAFSCAGAGISGSNNPGDTGDDKAISYDETRLFKGNVVIFDSKITNAQKYEWSYKKKGDNEYTPLTHFDRSRISLAFIEPGDYSIQLVTNDSATDSTSIEITIKDRVIDINTQYIDPDKFTGLMKFEKSESAAGMYTSSLRLNDSIMKFIRDYDDIYVYFDICIFNRYGSKGILDDFQISESVVHDAADPSPFAAIVSKNTDATDFPKIIWERKLRLDPVGNDLSIREISHIEHILNYWITTTDGQDQIDKTYNRTGDIGSVDLIISQTPPDEFYLMY